MESKDIMIPAPWGHIAVRLWGEAENTPVLAIHGTFDNVGSFDRILQLLPTNFHYICIDLPGHGRSSHWPQFSTINYFDYLLVYKLVVDYFNRKKYILLGHSLGASLAFLFAQIYPEYITNLILLDAIFSLPPQELTSYLRNLHESYFASMNKLRSKSPPEYTYAEALDKMTRKRMYGELSQEAAEPLLKRMMIPLENGKLQLSLDQRLKFYTKPLFDFRYISDFIEKVPILCPTLIILASESAVHHEPLSKIYKQLRRNKNIRFQIVEGSHDVHNVYPERVAPFIIEHLLMAKSRL